MLWCWTLDETGIEMKQCAGRILFFVFVINGSHVSVVPSGFVGVIQITPEQNVAKLGFYCLNNIL